MSAIDLAAIMDAITDTLTTGGRTENMYPYPAESIETPAVIVGYPPSIDFDVTFTRGSDRATFPVWFVVGRNEGRDARDALSAIIAGANSIKAILDGTLGGAVQTARVTDCKPDFIEVAGVPYLAAAFNVEVYS